VVIPENAVDDDEQQPGPKPAAPVKLKTCHGLAAAGPEGPQCTSGWCSFLGILSCLCIGRCDVDVTDARLSFISSVSKSRFDDDKELGILIRRQKSMLRRVSTMRPW
jgi:hypothetical protein